MQMNAPVVLRCFMPAWLCLFVEGPVACFPIVDASHIKLRQHIEHRLPCRGDECRPKRELDCTQLRSFPNVARWIHDKISAIRAIYEYQLRLGHDDDATIASKKF